MSLSLERKGQLFELGFAFLFIPLVVSTMDRAPIFLGGRILLWIGLFMLVGLNNARDGGRLSQFLRANRSPRAWLPALALLLAAGSLLQLFLGRLGFWAPPGRLATAGPVASLLFLTLFALSTALPMEALLRAYLPRRFPDMFPWLLGPLFTAWFYLGSWQPTVLLSALAGGVLLTLISRTKAPFWLLPVLHALGAWTVLCARLP